jgi:hypothetical protein
MFAHLTRYAGSYLQVWRQTDENWHDSGPQMFRHTIFDKRGAILWWLFEELLKVFTYCIFFSFEEQYLVWAKSSRNFTYETTYCKVLRHSGTTFTCNRMPFDKRGAILWWLFEELLKVFTWLVGFPYQLSIISALESILQILGENK